MGWRRTYNSVREALSRQQKGGLMTTERFDDNPAAKRASKIRLEDDANEIRLPCFGIIVRLGGDPCLGKIESPQLKEQCPHCRALAHLDCEIARDVLNVTNFAAFEHEAQMGIEYNATIDGIEAMILACACAGIDVASPAFVEAIEVAAESAANALP